MEPPELDLDLSEYQQREKRLRLLRQHSFKRNARVQRIRRSNVLFLFNLVAIFFLQIVAIYFFKRGFLLLRLVLPNISASSDVSSLLDIPSQTLQFYEEKWGQPNWTLSAKPGQLVKASANTWTKPKFKKAVILVIDALRFDFVVPINPSDPNYNPHYHNNFPLLYDTVRAHPENAALFKFIADPPTTTLQRLKGLTTGSLPTFVDAGSNFDGDELEEDNLILQFAIAGRNVSLIGDDTWDNLFHPHLSSLSWPYESLNVWDIHTVDNGVIEHLFPLLDKNNPLNDQWLVIVGHFLGMDHVGHRYGPDCAEMVLKQQQMNSEVAKVMDELDEDTLLVVMGDHGMDQTGNHGGDSKLELESTLFVYSKKPLFRTVVHRKSLFSLSEIDSYFAGVDQIDFVPSFALLMGIPIPFNNLGRPIPDLHSGEDHIEGLRELLRAHYLTILALQRYKLAIIEKDGSSPVADQHQFDHFFEIVQRVQNLDVNQLSNPKVLSEVQEHIIALQSESLELFRHIWAEFNNVYIYFGIGLMAASLAVLILVAKLIPLVVFTQLVTEFLTLIVLMSFLCLITFNATNIVLGPMVRALGLDILSVNLLALAAGIVGGFIVIIFDRYSLSWLLKQFLFFAGDSDAAWSAAALVLIALVEVVAYSSNSFIIFQDGILNFLLLNLGIIVTLVLVRRYLRRDPNQKENNLRTLQGIVHGVSFIVVQKLTSLIRTCREEQLNHCPKLMTVTHGASACVTTNTFSLASLGWLLFASLIFPNILEHFFTLGVNLYQNSARLWIGKFLRVILFANWLYWLADYIEVHPDFNSKFFNLSFEFLKGFKLTIARTVMGSCLLAANFVWSKGPLCIKLATDEDGVELDELDAANEKKVVGYNNIYGLLYLLLVLNFFGAILITNKPYLSIALMLLVYQILNTVELLDILELRNNMIGPVVFNMLGYSYFYATNHQITISLIKWELAFQLADLIVFPFLELPVILNLFGPFIIIALCVVLITIWKIPPNAKPISLLSKIVVNCLTLIMSQTIVTLSSLFFTNWFKRHLMVWKIFVPCFIFNSLILVVVNAVIIFVAFFFGVTKLVHQINRIFGK